MIHKLKYRVSESEHFGKIYITKSSYIDDFGCKSSIKLINDLPSMEKMIALKCDHVNPQTDCGTLHLNPMYHFKNGQRSHQEFNLSYYGLDEAETDFLKSCPETNVSGGIIICSDGIRRAVAVINNKIYRGSACGLHMGGAFESISGFE